jgi:hypothetical protein
MNSKCRAFLEQVLALEDAGDHVGALLLDMEILNDTGSPAREAAILYARDLIEASKYGSWPQWIYLEVDGQKIAIPWPSRRSRLLYEDEK